MSLLREETVRIGNQMMDGLTVLGGVQTGVETAEFAQEVQG